MLFMRITASTRLLSTATRMQEILWAARRLMASWMNLWTMVSSKRPKPLPPWLTEQLTQRVGEHPHVGEIRHIGLIHALELVADKKKTPYDPSRRMGYELYQKALSKGLLLRPLGDVLYFNPPLTISREELTFALDVLEDVLQSLS